MHLLLISLGPVQEFIASARKCRDLWFGSWLLSELSRAAAEGIVAAENRGEADVLIFPGATLDNAKSSVGNKILAQIHGDPAAIAKSARDSMKKRLGEIRDQVFERVGRGDSRQQEMFHRATAIQQIDDLMELVWAAVPLQGDYLKARTKVEGLIAAAKNSKRWSQPAWSKAVPKSSLDGIRESVLDEDLFDRLDEKDGEALRRAYQIHGEERLCGVGLLKRLGRGITERHDRKRGPKLENGDLEPERIFSTSHVASSPFRVGLERLKAEGAAAFNNYCTALEHKDVAPTLLWDLDVVPGKPDPVTEWVDGSIFYEGRLKAEVDEAYPKDAERAERAAIALRKFLADKKVKELGEPNAYYVILLADGDKMGVVIDAQEKFESHRKLSEALEAFASSARGTVDQHKGRLIYSGGDDVLALVPVQEALECARKLADDFATKLSPWTATVDSKPIRATLSVGLAVVHHIVPLDEALALARRAEKAAKDSGRNALCVLVKRRGGEAVEVARSWDWGDGCGLDGLLKEFIDMHRAGSISAKAQYELMDIGSRTDIQHGPYPSSKTDAELVAEKKQNDELRLPLQAIRAAESGRILFRKQQRGGATLTEAVRGRIEKLARDNPTFVGSALYVAQVFARAYDQAKGSVRTPEQPESEVTP